MNSILRFFKQRLDLELDFVALAPIDGDPRIRRHEMELRRVRNDRHDVRLAGLRPHFVGHRHAADTCTHDHNMSH
jgi:hypothetical protein